MSHKYLVAGMLPMAAFAHAQSSLPAIEDTMVVTASRFEQPVENIVAPISVISRSEIQQSQAKTLTEVLRRLPGVEVAVNGGIGQNASLFLRGTNSNHALILIDGVRMNNAIVSGINLNRLPLNQVERIELIRGSGVAMYGSDAIGGVLNIITRSALGTQEKSITVGVGSNQYREGNFIASGDISDNGHLKIAAGFQETEGFNVNPQLGLNDDKHGFDGSQIMVNYEHAIGKEWVGFTSLRWFDNTAQYNNHNYATGTYKVADSRSQSLSYTAKLEYDSAAYQSFWVLNFQDDVTTDTLPSQSDPIARIGIEQTNAQWANLYQLTPDIGLQGGFDWRSEKLAEDTLGYNASIAGERRNNTGGYVGASGAFGPLSLLSNLRFDKHDTYDEYVTWSLGAIYQLNDTYQFKASMGTSFKAPSYKAFADNPLLNPEEAQNIEIGFIAKYEPITFTVAAYDNKIDNLIMYYVESNDGFNVDARIRGVEFEALFDTGIVAHTLVAEFKDPKDTKGAQLARRAKENFKWIGDATFGDFDLSLSYVYTGKRPDRPTFSNNAGHILPAYSLWDFATTYWVTDELSLKGRVDNLFDEKYETADGYPAPERAYYLSMDYQF